MSMKISNMQNKTSELTYKISKMLYKISHIGLFFHDSPLIVSMSPLTLFYKYLMENHFPYFHILFCGFLYQ